MSTLPISYFRTCADAVQTVVEIRDLMRRGEMYRAEVTVDKFLKWVNVANNQDVDDFRADAELCEERYGKFEKFWLSAKLDKAKKKYAEKKYAEEEECKKKKNAKNVKKKYAESKKAKKAAKAVLKPRPMKALKAVKAMKAY